MDWAAAGRGTERQAAIATTTATSRADLVTKTMSRLQRTSSRADGGPRPAALRGLRGPWSGDGGWQRMLHLPRVRPAHASHETRTALAAPPSARPPRMGSWGLPEVS